MMTQNRRTAMTTPLVAALVLAACAGDAPSTGATVTDAPPLAELVVERPPPDSPDAAALAAGLNEVGYDLFAHAAGEADGAGVVLSPLSIGLALGMADAGASGATADALEALFAYPVGGDARLAAFNTLEQSVTGVADATVRLANRQFPDTGFVTVEPSRSGSTPPRTPPSPASTVPRSRCRSCTSSN